MISSLREIACLSILTLLFLSVVGPASVPKAVASDLQSTSPVQTVPTAALSSIFEASQGQTLQGVLEYESGDSPDHTIAFERYFLSTGETRTELLFDTPPWYGYLGKQVVVEGTTVSVQEEAALAIRVSHISLAPSEQGVFPTAVTGTRKVILVLLKFQGDSQEPHTPSWYTGIFNPSSGNTVNSFYLTNSWGKFGWSADATNWMTLPHSKTYYAPHNDWTHTDANYNSLFNDAVALATDVTFSNYDNIAIVTNNDLDCCAAGNSHYYYNGKYYGVVWEPPWSAQVGTFAHELGHSIGLRHSGWVYYAYDSPWDVMSKGDQIYNNVNCGSYSSANNGGNTNTLFCPTPADIIAPYKDQLGWIDSSYLLTVAAGSPATAQIDTLAAPLSANKKMIKICVAGKDCTSGGATAQYYTVEVRTHYTSDPGFDYYLQNEGVIIHYYWGDWTGPTHNSCYFNYQYGTAYPIDNFNIAPSPHYTGPPYCSESISGQMRGLYYANWNDGQTYTTTGTTIAIASHSTVGGVTTYVVNINGGNIPPTAIIDSTSPNPVNQGQPVTFTGHGTDPDDSVVAYSWRSSIDGQLSSSSSFTSSSLSVGAHTIYFKVQDNGGLWSTEVTSQLTVKPTGGQTDFAVSANPPSLTFTIPDSGSTGSQTSTITVSSLNGWIWAVDLTGSWIGVLPNDVSYTILPGSVTPPSGGSVQSTLTVTVGHSVLVGTYTLRISGYSNFVSHTTDVTIITNPPPPSATTWPRRTPDPPMGFTVPQNYYKGCSNGFGAAGEGGYVYFGVIGDETWRSSLRDQPVDEWYINPYPNEWVIAVVWNWEGYHLQSVKLAPAGTPGGYDRATVTGCSYQGNTCKRMDIRSSDIWWGPPKGLTATAVSSSQINLPWTSNTGGAETSFRIERATSSSGPFVEVGTVGTGVTSYQDLTGLAPGTTYYYRVRAYSSNYQAYTVYSSDSASEYGADGSPASATTSSGGVSVTITSNPAGSGYVKVDGQSITTPTSYSWTAGASHTIEAISTVSGGSGVQYVWIGWSDGGGRSHSITVPSSPTTYTASFKTQYYLTVSSAYDSPSPATGWYDGGQSITAWVSSPVSGPSQTRYVCTGWTGSGNVPASGTGTVTSFSLTAASSVTWNWETQYYLTMQVSPLGAGVTSPSSGWWDADAPVQIQAIPQNGYGFTSWLGAGSGSYSGAANPAFTAMNGPITETANFVIIVNVPPTISGLSPDRVSPQVVGSTIVWTCSASDADGDPILYRFWLQLGAGSWVLSQDWSSANTWGWTPSVAGSYNVGCWVRDGKHAGSASYDARLIINGYVITPNGPPAVSSLTPDKPSPQVAATAIVWTCSATDPENDPILYRFWLQAGTGAWVVTQDWSSSATWSWTPTTAGTYNVGCWVRDGKHAGATGYDARLIVNGYSITSAPPNGLPTVSDLKPDKASPQQVGTVITWTCSANDPEGDSISYRFWLQAGSGAWVVTQDWSGTNSWTWTPTAAGTYNVGCWVRDGKHAGSTSFDARLIVNGYVVTSAPPNGSPTVSGLSPDKVSPQVAGTTITWTCSANDPEGDSISYRFWLQAGSGAWVITQDWSSSRTWSWTPSNTGTYNVGCWVRDGKHAPSTSFDDRKIVNGYIITSVPPNSPPVLASLSSDKASPQQAGTAIAWTCSASDAEGDPILYRFWLQAGNGAWVVTQDWSSSNSWSWTPSVAGTYNVGVWVRDGKHAGPTGFDARLIVNGYSITSAPPNGPPTISELSPDKVSPQVVGTTVTWACSANDPEGDSISYRFWLQAGSGSWIVVQDWSSSNSWSWTRSAAGTYNVGCWVRDGKHAGPTGFDDRKIVYGYVVTMASASIQPPSSVFSSPSLVSLSVDGRVYYGRISRPSWSGGPQ